MSQARDPRRSAAIRRVAAEAVGTFFLVFIGPGSAMVNAYTGGALGPRASRSRSPSS